MPSTRSNKIRRRISFLLACLVIAGCGRSDKVQVLKFPKEPRLSLELERPPSQPLVPSTQTAEGPTEPFEGRMLAAMIPNGQRVWFFKMIGSANDVRPRRGEFRQMIESIKFDDADEPTWTLPETWTEKRGSGMRKATITSGPSAKAPSISVIGLRAPQDVLDNVNRWREQLQKPPIEQEKLDENIDRISLGDTEAIFADIIGTVDPDEVGPMRPPMMSGAGGAPPRAPVTERGRIGFKKPETWTSAAASGMRKLAFKVGEGEKSAEITVIALPPVAADVLDNVNRWRGQVGLPPLESIDDSIHEMTIAGESGHFADLLVSPDESKAIIAAMVERGENVWFFKMTGDGELLKTEQENFERFVKSIKFE